VPHADFERTLAYVTGLSNVRDAIPFLRTPATRGIDQYCFGARVSSATKART
jgi:hypothetical protein